jgi:hypothetical protein
MSAANKACIPRVRILPSGAFIKAASAERTAGEWRFQEHDQRTEEENSASTPVGTEHSGEAAHILCLKNVDMAYYYIIFWD